MSTNEAAWGGAIESWAVAMRAAGRSAQTVRLRTYHLGRLAGSAPGTGPWAVDEDVVAQWLAGHRWQAETRRSALSSVRTFYRWAVRTGRAAADPTVHLVAPPPAPPTPRPTPAHLYREALAKADRRERIMLRLAGDHGLRRGEVARVHSDDLFEDLDGWSLRVHGKGGRDRDVPLTSLVAAELRALPEGWAFPGDVDGHLSADWVGKLVARLLPGAWTMHTLRHRAGSSWYAVDHDLRAVQELLGHASLTTTQRYVASSAEARRRLVTTAAA